MPVQMPIPSSFSGTELEVGGKQPSDRLHFRLFYKAPNLGQPGSYSFFADPTVEGIEKGLGRWLEVNMKENQRMMLVYHRTNSEGPEFFSKDNLEVLLEVAKKVGGREVHLYLQEV